MTSTTRTILRTGIAALAAAGVAAGTGLAGAQVPGGDESGWVVKTDSNALLVDVTPAQPNASQVTGTIENTTGNKFHCGVPADEGVELPGQATTVGVVRLAVEYYAENIYTGADGFDIPLANNVAMGSIQDILPGGGSAGMMSGSSGTDNVVLAQQQARVDGHTGDPLVGGKKVFDVNANSTVNWTANMSVPSSGNRGEWQAAAMFYCIDQVTKQHYVFAGYEGFVPGTSPALPAKNSGSLSAGSLGA